MVSVQAYLCSDNMPLTWAGESSLEYVSDDAQVRVSSLDPCNESGPQPFLGHGAV